MSALVGVDDPGTVSFKLANFIIPTIGELHVRLSPADFANDFNGTVLATFLLPVPEPSSFALFGLTLAAAIPPRYEFRDALGPSNQWLEPAEVYLARPNTSRSLLRAVYNNA